MSSSRLVEISTMSGERRMIPAVEIEQFGSKLRGELALPGSAGYEQGRSIWNAMIDRRPALAARCAGTADVMQAVAFARKHDLLTAIRGGGHNIAGTAVCEGGLLIDLSALRYTLVDSERGIARTGPGCGWGDFDNETQPFGLSTPGGIVSETGVAGLTLGGGFGWMTRKHGLTCDSLLSAEVVTAGGERVRASREENSELFWGLRGGGGNFGVVTNLEFKLHEMGPMVMGGMVLYPMERARDVMAFYREFSESAPLELGSLAFMRTAPAAPALPESIHGKKVVGIAVCYCGPLEEGEQAVRRLKAFGSPAADLIGPKPFTAVQKMFDAGVPRGRRYYWKSEYLSSIEDGVIDRACEFGPEFSSPLSAMLLMQLGGRAKEMVDGDTSAANRDAEYVINIQSSWTEGAEDDRHIEWTRKAWEDIRPYSNGGTYVNFLGHDDSPERLRSAYRENYDRLRSLKATYDPDNFFRVNQNLRPADSK